MPGKKPAEAVDAYLHPLQQSIGCFTRKVLRPSGYDVDKVLLATLPAISVELLTSEGETLRLSFVQHFSVRKVLFGGYKVRTHSYQYGIENEYGHDILHFHWHPESTVDTVTFPHLHIGYGAADRLRNEFYGIHFPSGRVSFEEVGLLLLEHFKVEPERTDALKILTDNKALFDKYKTW